MNRRQLLLTLLAGTASAPLLLEAFEATLEPPTRSAEEWRERLDSYEREYVAATDVTHMQERLAGDLAQLHGRADHPALGVVTARLLTMYGLMLQNTTASGDEAPRWFGLGIRAADRSGDTATQVWARGRVAMSLAYHGLDGESATSLAMDALALSDRPSPGRLGAELALMRVDDAWRTLDALSGDALSNAAFSEWRMAHVVSRLAARKGDEPMALRVMDIVQLGLPSDVTWPLTTLGLQQALLMVRCGDRKGGVDHAVNVIDHMPPDESRPTIWRLLREIEA